MKGWKILAGVGAVTAATEYGIASYFFNRTMLRQNAATQRTIDMAGTNWNNYMPMLEKMKVWMMEQPREDVFVYSEDGLRLHGNYFKRENSKKVVLCFHGYTSQGMSDYIGLSNYYLPRDYNMILADERAHGESEGEYIGFGCLDRKDVLKWIAFAEEEFGTDCEIWLHGISMGGATVLMSTGQDLPASVKGVIADCAFTSAWDVFTHVLKSMYHLPAFPILHISNQMAKKRAGYGLAECNAAEEVTKAKIPVLLIHGDADTFVPSKMCYEIYNNYASDKDMLIIEGAGHAEAFYKDQEKYEEKLTTFLAKRGV